MLMEFVEETFLSSSELFAGAVTVIALSFTILTSETDKSYLGASEVMPFNMSVLPLPIIVRDFAFAGSLNFPPFTSQFNLRT